ncbi:cache domain-containing protein, partial [Sulfurimonas sp.]|uniref:cache domain-containing protein n=1 Tax=Sulfurimonas sp. TaxID=2022749 RepID=UPI0025F45F5D
MKLGFKQKILFFSGVLLTLSLLVFAIVSYSAMKETLVKELEYKQLAETKTLSLDIESWLNSKLTITKALSHNLAKLTLITKENSISSLSLAKNAIKASYMYAGLDDGTMIYASGKAKKEGYDPRVRPWYKDAIRKNGPVLTDIYISSSSKEPTISGAIPIFINNQAKGVTAFDLSIRTIMDKVYSTKFEGGYAFVIDKNGKFIMHPSQEFMGKTIYSIDKSLQDLEKKILATKSGVYEYNYKGENKFLTFIKINNGWTIMVPFFKTSKTSFLISPLYDTSGNSFCLLGS